MINCQSDWTNTVVKNIMVLLKHAYAKCFHFYLSRLLGVFIISIKGKQCIMLFPCPSPIMSIFTSLQFLRYFRGSQPQTRLLRATFHSVFLMHWKGNPSVLLWKCLSCPPFACFSHPATFLKQTSCPHCLPSCGQHSSQCSLASAFSPLRPLQTSTGGTLPSWKSLVGLCYQACVLDSLSGRPWVSTKGALEGSVCRWWKL